MPNKGGEMNELSYSPKTAEPIISEPFQFVIVLNHIRELNSAEVHICVFSSVK